MAGYFHLSYGGIFLHYLILLQPNLFQDREQNKFLIGLSLIRNHFAVPINNNFNCLVYASMHEYIIISISIYVSLESIRS